MFVREADCKVAFPRNLPIALDARSEKGCGVCEVSRKPATTSWRVSAYCAPETVEISPSRDSRLHSITCRFRHTIEAQHLRTICVFVVQTSAEYHWGAFTFWGAAHDTIFALFAVESVLLSHVRSQILAAKSVNRCLASSTSTPQINIWGNSVGRLLPPPGWDRRLRQHGAQDLRPRPPRC